MNGSSFKNKIDFLVCSCRSCLQDSFAPDWGAPDAHWVMRLSQEDCSSFAFNVSSVPGTTSLMWAATYWWNWMLWNGREHQKAHFLVKAFGQPKKKPNKTRLRESGFRFLMQMLYSPFGFSQTYRGRYRSVRNQLLMFCFLQFWEGSSNLLHPYGLY